MPGSEKSSKGVVIDSLNSIVTSDSSTQRAATANDDEGDAEVSPTSLHGHDEACVGLLRASEDDPSRLGPQNPSSPVIAISPPAPEGGTLPNHDSEEAADTTGLTLNPVAGADNGGPLTPPTTNASIDNESRRASDTLLASLRRLAALRFRLLELRVSAKAESRLIRNLHGQLIKELYKLYNLVPNLHSPLKGISTRSITKDPTEWDVCLVEIEDCIEKSEEAGRRFERKQDTIDEIEEQLQNQEDGVYESYVTIQQPTTSTIKDEMTVEKEEPAFEIDLTAEFEKFVSLSKTPLQRPTEALIPFDEDHILSSSSTPDPEEQFLEFEDENYIHIGEDSFDGDFVKLFGPISDDYSQFSGSEIGKLIEQTREAALKLDSKFSKSDVDRFFRWLAYGRPFSDRLVAPIEEPPLPRSMLSLFRTWIWHSLALLSAGLQIPAELPPRSLNPNDVNFERIRAVLAQNWLWDPHTYSTNARSEASTSEKDRLPEADAENTVVDRPQSNLNVPLQPRQSQSMAQTNINTGTADHAYSRHDTFKPPPLSVQSNSHIGRSDFASTHPRRLSPNRRASSF